MVLSTLHILANFPHSDRVGREHYSLHFTDEGNKNKMTKVIKLGNGFVSWDLNQVICLSSPSLFLFAVMLIGNLSNVSDKVASLLKSLFPKFRPQWQWQELLLRGIKVQGGHLPSCRRNANLQYALAS